MELDIVVARGPCKVEKGVQLELELGRHDVYVGWSWTVSSLDLTTLLQCYPHHWQNRYELEICSH